MHKRDKRKTKWNQMKIIGLIAILSLLIMCVFLSLHMQVGEGITKFFSGDKQAAEITRLPNTDTITYIYTPQDLVDFRNAVNAGNNYAGKTVKLMANIDLSEVCSEVLGSWTPIGDNGADSSLHFSGTFNGNNHTIKNIYIYNTNTGRNGLFGQVARGKIENLTITGSITSNKSLVGGIAGQIAHNAVVENCKNYANVTCSHTDTTYTVAGGITGQSYNSDIIKCENYGTITAPNCTGGIAGQINVRGTIQDCYNEGTVRNTVASASGGILGYCVANTKATIYNCKNVGYIEVAVITGAGGIVGGSGGKLDIYNCINEGRCYSKGSGAAGILGYNDKNSTMTRIKYCFNKGAIHAEKWGAGGIAGSPQRNTEITHCSNTGEIIATNGNSGGIVGATGLDDTVITYAKIDNCFNQGYIHSQGNTEGHPVAGGIMGCVQLGDYAVITNCYNVGKIASTSYTSGYVAHGVGGILGTIWNNQKATTTKSKATIQNCYNIGNITNSYSSSNTGQVIGKSYTGQHTITNCHYLSTAAGSNSLGGISQTASNLKALAPTLGDEFTTDTYTINQGYPILKWQIQPVLNIRQEYIKIGQVFDVNILQTEMLQKVLGNYDDTHFTWTSSNEEIASVDEQGRVTGKQLGSTTITATHTNGMKARAIVSVMNSGEDVVTMPSVQVAEFYDDARSTFTAFLKEDGTVWTTGNNTYGQLGNGTTTSSKKFVQVKIDANTYLTNVKKISVGDNSVLALTTSGEVYGWGLNNTGQLGQGNSTNSTYAVKVKNQDGTGFLQDIIDVNTGYDTSFFLDRTGTVYACGYQKVYRLGNGVDSTTAITLPIVLPIHDVIKVSANQSTGIIAMTGSGKAYAVGANTYGELGIGNTTNQAKFLEIGKDVVDIGKAIYQSAIVTSDKELFVTGINNYGQLGLGDTTDRNTWTKVPGFGKATGEIEIREINLSGTNMSVLDKNGNAYVVGGNNYGELSQGDTTGFTTFRPMKNADGTQVSDAMLLIKGGTASYEDIYQKLDTAYNMGIVRQDGTIWMAGRNQHGQIGNSTKEDITYLTLAGNSKVTLDNRQIYFKLGQTQDIGITKVEHTNVFLDNEVSLDKFDWSSSNEEVASIDSTGKITGNLIGSTAITGSAYNGGIKIRVMVHVLRANQNAITMPQVEIGQGAKTSKVSFTVILKEDGSVWSSGANNFGQLGDGTTINRTEFAPVKISENETLTGIKKIAVGRDHVLALTHSGEVYSWGNNQYGQLGDGTKTNSLYATKVKNPSGTGNLTNIVDISAGFPTSFFLTEDGQVYGCGWGSYYRLGVQSQEIIVLPTKLAIENIVAVFAGQSGSPTFMDIQGKVYSIGINDRGQMGNGKSGTGVAESSFVEFPQDIVLVAKAEYQTAVVTSNKELYVTSLNNYGQLGVGDITTRTTWTKVDGFGKGQNEIEIRDIKLSGSQAMILDKTGKVYVTGGNQYGQLSQGNTTLSTTFIPMKNDDGTEVTDASFLLGGATAAYDNLDQKTGTGYNLGIIREDGSVWMSGRNQDGQMGNTNSTSNYLVKAGMDHLYGAQSSYTIKEYESVAIPMQDFYLQNDANVFSQKIEIENIEYEAENEAIASVTTRGMIVGVTEGITRIKVTDLDSGEFTYVMVRVLPENGVAQPQVSLGKNHSIAVKQNGSIWTWGNNAKGQLGLGNTENQEEPVCVASLTDGKQVVAGADFSLVLKNDGTVWSFGQNSFGQLGTGNTENSHLPVLITSLSNVVKITADKFTSYALTVDGTIYAWGSGYGMTPTLLTMEETVIDVSSRLALTQSGQVYQLSQTPQKVEGMKNISKIASSSTHCLAIDSQGNVYSWGENTKGQLGKGNTISGELPYKISTITNAFDIACGEGYSLVMTLDRKLYGFGDSSNYQLGRTEGSQTPTLLDISMLSANLDGLAAGSTHTMIYDTEGFVYTSGINQSGELGIKGLGQATVFTKIYDEALKASLSQVTVEIGKQEELSFQLGNTFNLKQEVSNVDQFDYQTINQNSFVYDGSMVTGIAYGEGYVIATHIATGAKLTVPVKVVPIGGKVLPQVEQGQDFTVLLKADGTVWTYGKNKYGNLGTGDNKNRNTPICIVGTQINESVGMVTNITAGNSHALLLNEQGQVYSFGYNKQGQGGTGGTTNCKIPTKVLTNTNQPLSNIIKVVAGNNSSFAIDKQGNIWAWGTGYTKKATKIPNITDVIDVSSKYYLKTDGKVYDLTNQTALSMIGKIKAISEGEKHTVFLTETGTAYGMGDNTYGQLGNGVTNSNQETPVAVRTPDGMNLLEGIRDIKAGKGYTILVKEDGKVYTFGSNSNGKLGYEQNASGQKIEEIYLPTQVTSVNNIIGVEAGLTDTTTVVTADGFVYSFGKGLEGQLGNRENLNSITPVMVGDYLVKAKNVGITNTITMKPGEVKNLDGYVDYFNIIQTKDQELNYYIKDSRIARINTTTGELSSLKTGKTKVQITQTGTNHIAVVTVEVLPEGAKVMPDVSLGTDHSMVLKADGSVWTWGKNTYGQLGTTKVATGESGMSDDPILVEFPEGTVIEQIQAGSYHNLALDKEGNVWSFGRNNYWQLGNSSLAYTATPMKIDVGEKAVKIAAGSNHNLILGESGTLYTFGLNSNGECGAEFYNNKLAVMDIIAPENIIDITAGKNHSMLLKSDGTVYTTGSNLYGQLGIENESKINLFTKVKGLEKIASIEAGEANNFVYTMAGEGYTWGSNVYGSLGTGDKLNKGVPTKLEGMANLYDLSSGRSHASILNENGDVYTVGSNLEGQLGDGTLVAKQQFSKLETIQNCFAIASGDTYTVAIKTDGTVWAWGDYHHGDIAYKSKTNTEKPMRIGNDETSLAKQEMTIKKSSIEKIEMNGAFRFNVWEAESLAGSYRYESLNRNIATVGEDGAVLGVREGTTWVKAIDETSLKEYIVLVHVIDNTRVVAPKIEGGQNHTVSLKADGSIWTWGYNSHGELGNGNNQASEVPGQTNILATYRDIAVGKNFAVALREDGTVWSFGQNNYGQLGNGKYTDTNKLIQVNRLADIKQIAVGDGHAIYLDSYGMVYGVGKTKEGQLGNGFSTPITMATKLNLPTTEQIIQVAAGGNQSVFVTAKGEVYGYGTILNKKLEGITNVVKVTIGEDSLYILKTDGTICRYQNGTFTQIAGVTSVIDMEAKGNQVLYQTQNEEIHKLEANTSTKVAENGYGIGVGYQNSYYIANTGFVYSTGANSYGQIGNGTRNPYDTYTIVGDRNFAVEPENKIMTVGDEESLSMTSKLYHVFRENSVDVHQYEYTVQGTSITQEITTNPETSLESATLTAVEEGTSILTITDKLTGEAKQATRIVVPMDLNRIESLAVNGVSAKPVEQTSFEVEVPTDDSGAQIAIKTLNQTDKISLDGTNFTESGVLNSNILLPDKENTITFVIETANGTKIEYLLKVIKKSVNTNLSEVSVNGKQATWTGVNSYEAVLEENETIANIIATTEENNAKVSIDGKDYQNNISNQTLTIDSLVKVVPILVESESGRIEEHTLTIYQKSALISIESITVAGKGATKVNETEYKVVVPRTQTKPEVNIVATYDNAKIKIGDMQEEIKNAIKQVSLTEESMQIPILITAMAGEEQVQKEYTLTIEKQREDAKLDMVIVNGKDIKAVGTRYEVSLPSNALEANVKIVSSLDTDRIQIDNGTTQIHTLETTLPVTDTTNTYIIKVTDGETLVEKQYTLVLTKPSANVKLKQLRVRDNQVDRVAKMREDGSYEVKVVNSSINATIIAIAEYANSKVSIQNSDYTVGYQTKDIELVEGENQAVIKVQAEDGTEQEYLLHIIRMSNNTQIDKVQVNGVDCIKTESNIYEYSVTSMTDSLPIQVKLADSNAMVKIENGVYTKAEGSYTKILDSKEMYLRIMVKAEDETEKEYFLRIIGLPDNSGIDKIVVNGSEAIYREGRYQVRRPITDTNYVLEATLLDRLATIQVENEEPVIGALTKTITKQEGETIVNLTVTAQDGKAKSNYQVAIMNQSNNSDIGLLKVNNQIVAPQEDGNYLVRVKHDLMVANVELQADDEYASSYIAGITNSQPVYTKEVSLPENTNSIPLKIVAENGESKEVILTIEKMSGNTNIADISVNGEMIDLTGITEENRNITYKIDRITQAEIVVNLADALSKVSLNGNTAVAQTQTITLQTVGEQTILPIEVTAEDGTTKAYTLYLTKKSEDISIDSLTMEGIDPNKITKNGEYQYEVEVDSRVENITFTMTTANANTKIRLSTDAEEQVHTMTKTVTLPEMENAFTIVVTSETGKVQNYTLKVKKVYSLEMESIVADAETVQYKDGKYIGWVDRGETANVIITPDNQEMTVTLLQENTTLATGTGILNTNVTINGEIGNYVIQIAAPDGSKKEYGLTLTKKSNDNTIASVKIDEELLNAQTPVEGETLPDYQKLLSVKDSYTLEVKATQEHAKVKIGNGEFQEGKALLTFSLNPEEVRNYVITVQSHSGEEKTYTLQVTKASQNVNLSEVKVNETIVTAGENGNYHVFVDNTLEKITVGVILAHEKASVTVDGTSIPNPNPDGITKEIPLTGVVTQVPIVVTSENGDTKTYTLAIEKESSDTSIEELKVDGKVITPSTQTSESGETTVIYHATVLDSLRNIEVYGKTVNHYASISVNGQTGNIHEVTQTVPLQPVADKKTEQFVIQVTAQDGTVKEALLEVTKLSNNNQIGKVLVNGVEPKQENGNYYIYVTNNLTTASIELTAQHDLAQVALVPVPLPEAGTVEDSYVAKTVTKDIVLNGNITTITLKVKAENGSVLEKQLEIRQLPNNIEINNITVNGKKANLTAEGNYEVEALDTDSNYQMTIQAGEVSSSITAQIPVGGGNTDSMTAQGSLTTSITATGEKQIAIPIHIEALDGATRDCSLTILVKSTNTNVAQVQVNGTIVTDKKNNTYYQFIPKDQETATVKLTAEDALSSISYEGTITKQEVELQVPVTEEQTTVNFKVISEHGEEKTYHLVLTKVSDDNTIQELKVGNTVIVPNEVGNYAIEVSDDQTQIQVAVKMNHEYASVRIGQGTETIQQLTETISLGNEKVQTITITTKSQTGIVATKTLTITKISHNTNLQTILVDDQEVTDYEESRKRYLAMVDNMKDQFEVFIMAQSDLATIELIEVNPNDNTTKVLETGKGSITTLLTIPESSKELKVQVTSEAGEKQMYTLVLVKKSNNTNLTTLKINDLPILPVDEEGISYEKMIPKQLGEITIQMILEDPYAKLRIGDEEVAYGEATRTISLNLGEDKIIIPIVVTATDKLTSTTYIVTLTRGSDNTAIDKIQVEGKQATISETIENRYEVTMPAGLTEVETNIVLVDVKAKVELDGKTQTGALTTKVTIPEGQDVITKTIRVTSEDGTIKEYSLVMTKMSSVIGKVITQNTQGENIATVEIYHTADREKVEAGTITQDELLPVTTMQTKDDGTYGVELEAGEYDVVITKSGYLKHTITHVLVEGNEASQIGEINLLAGDLNQDGHIEIDDLVMIEKYYGTVPNMTQEQYELLSIEKQQEYDRNLSCDFNGDGVVNKEDRNILKQNYDNTAKEEIWVRPIQNYATFALSSTSQTPNENGMVLPMDCQYQITSNYGYRIHPITGEEKKHTGIDISGKHHTSIYAVANGEVTYAGVQNGYGNCIEIKHEINGEIIYSFYAHLSEISVKTGEKVTIGQVIGKEGGDPNTDTNAGDSTGHHLHFEIRTSSGYGNDVDPTKYLAF